MTPRIFATTIEGRSGHREFVLFEEGCYLRPIAILTEAEAEALATQLAEGLKRELV